jgi:hypothetical protein
MLLLLCSWLLVQPSHAAAWTGLRKRGNPMMPNYGMPSMNDLSEATGLKEVGDQGGQVPGSQEELEAAAKVQYQLGQSQQQLGQADTNEAVETLTPAIFAPDENASFAADDGIRRYVIATFPRWRTVNYVRLPDLVWRPIITDLVAPHSIAVDEDRARLYIADTGAAKIFWYQLTSMPGGQLMISGSQKVAVSTVSARNLALDLQGSLWFSGASTPLPPIPSIDAIWKQSLHNIDSSSLTGVPIDASPVWRTKELLPTVPAPLALDAFSIYFGSDGQGKKKGAVIKTAQEVPIANPSNSVKAMADNFDKTYSVAVTPTALFYGVEKGIYGILKTKGGGSCGAKDAQCTLVTKQVQKPTSMIWDGDGSIYLADAGAGAIYSFASGSVTPHALEKVIDAAEVYGMDIFRVNTEPKDDSDGGSCSRPADGWAAAAPAS